MRSLFFVAALALAGLPCISRAQIVAANNIPSGYTSSGFFIGIGYTDNQSFTNEAAAQEFRANASGELFNISASVDKFSAGAIPVTVSLFAESSGLPGALLGSKSFDPSLVSSNAASALTTFDLASLGISLTSGIDYVVTFTTTAPLFQNVRYRALLTANSVDNFGNQPLFSRNGGSTWQGEGIPNEIGVIVRVTPSAAVPEPGTYAILGGLLVPGLIFVRQRRLQA